MPKPDNNHGFDVSSLVHDTKDSLPDGSKLGPTIQDALAAIQHQHGPNAPDAGTAALNQLGHMVHDLVHDNVPPTDGGLGDLVSTHVHDWIG